MCLVLLRLARAGSGIWWICELDSELKTRTEWSRVTGSR